MSVTRWVFFKLITDMAESLNADNTFIEWLDENVRLWRYRRPEHKTYLIMKLLYRIRSSETNPTALFWRFNIYPRIIITCLSVKRLKLRVPKNLWIMILHHI